MPAVFADAGYWIAMWDPADSLHEKAMAVSRSLQESTILTTQLVLIEALNLLSRRGSARRAFAVEMAHQLESNPDVEVVPASDRQFWAAVEMYAERRDQRWSLTDCASFLVMESRGIRDALAYDHDFEQAGFSALLRDT